MSDKCSIRDAARTKEPSLKQEGNYLKFRMLKQLQDDYRFSDTYRAIVMDALKDILDEILDDHARIVARKLQTN